MDVREQKRLAQLTAYEAVLRESYGTVAGIDEVGRGCLAGPVTCAVVIPGGGTPLEGINDSKKVSPTKREYLYEKIYASAIAVGVGHASPAEIDLINIYQATRLAMMRAVRALPVLPGYLLIDGMSLDIPLPSEKVIGGDRRCYAIAAASIVAKVTRDRLMCRLHNLFPQYGFEQHKGYGTKMHLQALQDHLPNCLHRWTFAPVAAFA